MDYEGAVEWLRKRIIPAGARHNVVDVVVSPPQPLNIMLGNADREQQQVFFKTTEITPVSGMIGNSDGDKKQL